MDLPQQMKDEKINETNYSVDPGSGHTRKYPCPSRRRQISGRILPEVLERRHRLFGRIKRWPSLLLPCMWHWIYCPLLNGTYLPQQKEEKIDETNYYVDLSSGHTRKYSCHSHHRRIHSTPCSGWFLPDVLARQYRFYGRLWRLLSLLLPFMCYSVLCP